MRRRLPLRSSLAGANASSTPGLQHIHRYNTSLSKTGHAGLQFPALRELSLIAADPPNLLPLLAASLLPHLSIFSIILLETDEPADDDYEPCSWADLELESLTLGATGGEEFVYRRGAEPPIPAWMLLLLWRTTTRHLTLCGEAAFFLFGPILSTSTETLTIAANESYTILPGSALVEALTEDGGAPQLRKIYIPSVAMYEYWLQSDTEDLASFCEENGIELVGSMECWPKYESKVELRTFHSVGEVAEVDWVESWEGPPELWCVTFLASARRR